MQDGAKEDGARNSDTCFATKKFLTEGLGFLARGAEVELQMHTVLLANSNFPYRKAETCSQRISWSNYHKKDSCQLPGLYGGQDYVFQWIFGSAADS